MKKALVEVVALLAVLGFTASQVKSNQATNKLGSAERKVEAVRLGTVNKPKWTAKRKVAGVPLQKNHPAVQSSAVNKRLL
ncbi:hypothetical protein D1831_06135 [Lactiplantibacillus garii]|uniref:Uncharacterized protein n=1 Tax=Lactiplantibacillus garii TaxID=2306423 RepID=A0A426D825_9LACO|nr:hypothetical protein [Lactiplantibacillus garii]RRK10753.1 hypothetical protein D1831_06135 [Lactiplantibacillus garii]